MYIFISNGQRRKFFIIRLQCLFWFGAHSKCLRKKNDVFKRKNFGNTEVWYKKQSTILNFCQRNQKICIKYEIKWLCNYSLCNYYYFLVDIWVKINKSLLSWENRKKQKNIFLTKKLRPSWLRTLWPRPSRRYPL